MFNLHNPFKYVDGFWGFLYTWVFCLLSMISGAIGFITFTIWMPLFEFTFAAWYTKRKMEKRLRDYEDSRSL